ncbi:MAG: alpha/beta fold hydrolase [Nocardioides sp.]|uniref:alpha/beta fold hydrolase n=1 Tax=Nocardioides sp. TaxID=35761 RepID=UPI003F08590D
MTSPRLTRYARDGLHFDVTDRGPSDGEPVVLLHGFPQRATCWDEVSVRLNEAGLRTVAPDQRGYSPGARPTGRRAYHLSELVADVVTLIDLLGGSAHVVGHDWGGNVAWALASAHPDKVRTLTALSVPHPRALVRAMRTLPQARRSWYVGGFQVPWLPERGLAAPFGRRALRASGMDDAMVATYEREMVADGALTGAVNWYRGLLVGGSGGFGRTVTVPTTYVWSDGDTALGPEAAAMCGQYVSGDYRFVTIHGASHWLPDQRPDQVAEAVLDRVGRGG